MDPFSYLSVLIGLILGLGIAHLMEGIGQFARYRGQIAWHWPAKLWVGILLALHIQCWWAMYELRHIESWTFPMFLTVLIQPILLFLLAAVALPELQDNQKIDFESAFANQAPFTFTVAALMVLSSLAKEWVLYDRLPRTQNLAFHVLLILLFLAARLVRSSRFQAGVVLLTALLIASYIALLFGQLV